MGRGKLSMKLISNEKSRKTTFHKRKASLLRKAYELSTLCDVRVCVFVHGPNQSNDQSPLQLHTWPPCPDEVNSMIASYKTNCLHKRARKAFGLIDFFSERKKKVETDMSKLRKDVAEARFTKWDERLDHLLEDQLRVLMMELDSKIEIAKKRIEIETECYNVEEGTSVESSQTLNANMKHKQVMRFDPEEESTNYGMFGIRSSMEQTQGTMPFHQQYHHQQQLQTMAQSCLQMDHEIETLSPFLFGSNGSAPQFQLSCGSNNNNNNNCFQNYPHSFYNDPTNGMIMENTQSYSSMCHYGVPFGTQSVVPISYMQMQQLTGADDQMMMGYASSSQMPLPNSASSQVINDQFDFYNSYEYFMKPNSF
ncbi:floral homeotic protein APETALA 3-like [Cucumis melo]|uniref:Floral homeotic protein APETALA 3-like n=1 Tax=Cucumis melo TaxID=3656 RepID=A0A1S3CDG6_CUCME|nr:floral homeotic protein APETALA 3-like [Cucumis melo]